MKRLTMFFVVVIAIFTTTVVFGYSEDPVGEGGSYIPKADGVGDGGTYVPKVDGPDTYPNYEKACLDIEKIILAYDPLGEGGSLVPKADGPGEGGSYVPKVVMPNNSGSYKPIEVAMAETDDSSNSTSSSSSNGSAATDGISS